MAIGAGLSSTGLTGAAKGAGAGLSGAFPWMLAAEAGIGAISAATDKFQLQEDSTIDDVKAHAAQRAGQIPIIGSLFSGLAQKVAERKWQPVFDNRTIKQNQMSDFMKSDAKMDSIIQQRMERLQEIPLLNAGRSEEIGNAWQNY